MFNVTEMFACLTKFLHNLHVLAIPFEERRVRVAAILEPE